MTRPFSKGNWRPKDGHVRAWLCAARTYMFIRPWGYIYGPSKKHLGKQYRWERRDSDRCENCIAGRGKNWASVQRSYSFLDWNEHAKMLPEVADAMPGCLASLTSTLLGTVLRIHHSGVASRGRSLDPPRSAFHRSSWEKKERSRRGKPEAPSC